MSVDKGGRLAGQSTSPTLPQDATGEAGQCQRTSGSKPPTSIDIRQALRTYATKLANSREYQRGEPDMRQHGDRMLAECLAFENEIADEIERLRAEVLEQCRLNGMGGSREAKLLAENAQLRARVAELETNAVMWQMYADAADEVTRKLRLPSIPRPARAPAMKPPAP